MCNDPELAYNPEDESKEVDVPIDYDVLHSDDDGDMDMEEDSEDKIGDINAAADHLISSDRYHFTLEEARTHLKKMLGKGYTKDHINRELLKNERT